MEYKTVVLCLKLLTCLIVQRSLGNIFYTYVQTYDTLKTDKLRNYEKLKVKIKRVELDLQIAQHLMSIRKFFHSKFQTLIHTRRDL